MENKRDKNAESKNRAENKKKEADLLADAYDDDDDEMDFVHLKGACKA